MFPSHVEPMPSCPGKTPPGPHVDMLAGVIVAFVVHILKNRLYNKINEGNGIMNARKNPPCPQICKQHFSLIILNKTKLNIIMNF